MIHIIEIDQVEESKEPALSIEEVSELEEINMNEEDKYKKIVHKKQEIRIQKSRCKSGLKRKSIVGFLVHENP